MGRWSYLDSDEERLPEGMTRVGYDADEGVYLFRDADGSCWQGVPGRRYGPMYRVRGPFSEPQPSSSPSPPPPPYVESYGPNHPPYSNNKSTSSSAARSVTEPYVANYPRNPDPEFIKLWNNQGSNRAPVEDGRGDGEPSKLGEAVQGIKTWATKQITLPSRRPTRSPNRSNDRLVNRRSGDEDSDSDSDIDWELEEKEKTRDDPFLHRSGRVQRQREKSGSTPRSQSGTLLRFGQFIGDALSLGSGPSSKPSLYRRPTTGHASRRRTNTDSPRGIGRRKSVL